MVAQRSFEIRLRMALGAQRTDILRQIVRRRLILTLTGIIAGPVLTAVVTRTLKEMLYGVHSSDPEIFAAMGVVLLLVCVAASSIPAYRAARLDPNQTLRKP